MPIFMKTKRFNEDKICLSYIIGVALGDGNLSKLNGRSVRLRITCDLKYPFLIGKIQRGIQTIFPHNKVTIVKRKQNCLDISCYSNQWEEILGWKASSGPKFMQNVGVPDWIKKKNIFMISCLRGLIETDGAVYSDRGYKMVIFKSVILRLANDVRDMIMALGFQPKFYQIEEQKKYGFKQQRVYQIRLSKQVTNFLAVVAPEKR